MAAKACESISKSGLALAVARGVVNSALYNVEAGHRAVIFDQFRGVQDIVVGEATFSSSHGYRNQLSLTAVLSHVMCQSSLVAKIYRTSHCASSSSLSPAFPRIFTSIGEDYDELVLLSITTESSSQWWLALMLEN
ncbi:hypothetical protein P7K49_034373 [Saguinus oedipus]|uniref:Prohibitin n=1 Tax=Saguinus oedipus TaxID=9490 RepID=A0ABQ9TUJ8_SAGOE|nr:hypothetical protein P7K49_034373 [Saguinus oedipus]